MKTSADKKSASPSLEISWVTSPDISQVLQEEWYALVERTGAEIYLSPHWFVPWWKHFGEKRQLACLVARQEGVLVGLLPFSLEVVWVGPLPTRIARFAGTDPNCMIFTLPIEPEFSPHLLQVALEYLLNNRHCSAVSFSPVSEHATFLKTIVDLGHTRSDMLVTDRPDGSHVIFDLPDTFTGFLADRLSKKRRGQFRRDLAGLEAAFSMTARRVTPSTAEFDSFVTFHNLQWNAVGKGGHFADWPESVAFYKDVVTCSDTCQGIHFYHLAGATAPLATQFALTSGQTCHWRLPARSLDPEAERLSVGKVGLVVMIQQLIESGIRKIEAGRGEYGYKQVYGGENVPVHRLMVSKSRGLARVRLALLLGWADLLNLLYYRIWFLKLAPRLRRLTGGKPRPLWRSWIRTRL